MSKLTDFTISTIDYGVINKAVKTKSNIFEKVTFYFQFDRNTCYHLSLIQIEIKILTDKT